MLGLTGSPGAGKSTWAAALVDSWGGASSAVLLPMDGFHLADVELRRRGLLERKGAPETFDAEGFKAVKEVVEAQIEEQSMPYFLSGMLYDDGVIDPRDTRTVLGICLSVIENQPWTGAAGYGVFRM